MSRQKLQGVCEDASVGSSGSWYDREGADIIDLDQYMRGARPEPEPRGHQLVVDGGGGRRQSAATLSSKHSNPSRQNTFHLNTKPISHDSGLSDGSNSRYRRRKNRHVTESRRREAQSKRSGESLQAFRVSCELALKEQQAQIAQVAKLCDRLAAPQVPPALPTPATRTTRAQPHAPPVSDTSDLSLSSNDFPVKKRMNNCKTYKIIMSKLDELNNILVSRANTGGPGAGRPQGQSFYHQSFVNRRRDSSSSISVSDKVVNTEVRGMDGVGRVIFPKVTKKENNPQGQSLADPRSESATSRSGRMCQLQIVAPTHVLDIAPGRGKLSNVATENVVSKCESSKKELDVTRDRTGCFESDDPDNV